MWRHRLQLRVARALGMSQIASGLVVALRLAQAGDGGCANALSARLRRGPSILVVSVGAVGGDPNRLRPWLLPDRVDLA